MNKNIVKRDVHKFNMCVMFAETIHYVKHNVFKTAIKTYGYLKFKELINYILFIINKDDFELIRSTLKENQKLKDKLIIIEFNFKDLKLNEWCFDYNFSFNFNECSTIDNFKYSKEYRDFIKLSIKKYIQFHHSTSGIDLGSKGINNNLLDNLLSNIFIVIKVIDRPKPTPNNQNKKLTPFTPLKYKDIKQYFE